MQLKISGNGLCTSCHSPAKFDVPSHTFHQLNSTGSECVNCHMPVTTYMVVDDRRDHSIRIPRPDLSLSLNTPNACNKCHTDKTVKWASENFLKWYKDKLPTEKTYGELMHSISKFSEGSEANLNDLLNANAYPAIIKASALEQYTVFATQRTTDQVQRYLQSTSLLLRLSALKALANFPPETVAAYADKLMDDAVASVRFEAMLRLASLSQQLSQERRMVFDKVFNEYIAVQQGLTNRPEGFLNQGIVLGMTGKWDEAESIYLQGINRFPRFVMFYMNLADVYRSESQEAKAKEYIDKGLALQPKNADLHYALGLWYVRQKDHTNGIKEFKKAFALEPSNASVVYGYAVAVFSTGQPSEAIAVLESFLTKNGNNAMILEGLISICQDQKLLDKANRYALLRKNVFGY